MPDEFALLPRDRVDGRHISGVGERHESRDAFSRKRHLVESVAAQDGDLCELHLRPRVAKTLHHLRHGAELRFVPPLPGGVVCERGREIVEPVGIERLGRDDRLVALIAFGRRLRRRQGKPRLAELLRGELAVVGDRLARRTLVEPLGPLGIAHVLRRSPLPIGGAGDGERSVGRLRRASEAVGGDRSVMKEAERDPAGMEGGVDPSPRTCRVSRSHRRLRTRGAARRDRGARARPSCRSLHHRSGLMSAARSCGARLKNSAAS